MADTFQLLDLEKAVLRAQTGDRQAVEELLASHRQVVYALAYSYLRHPGQAEEAAQEAFLRIFSRLGSLKNPGTFKSWCLTITANLCRDLLRQKRPQLVPLEMAPEVVEPISDRSLSDRLRTGLETLSEPIRHALLLRDVEGFSYEEVAEIQRIPLGTVKSRIFEARRKLRKWMTPCDVKS